MSAGAVTNIKDVSTRFQDDAFVQIQGKIVRQIDHDEFIVLDKTGQIRVEIDPEDFRGQADETTTLLISW